MMKFIMTFKYYQHCVIEYLYTLSTHP